MTATYTPGADAALKSPTEKMKHIPDQIVLGTVHQLYQSVNTVMDAEFAAALALEAKATRRKSLG